MTLVANAGNILFRQECRTSYGVMEDEERREGVGVLKEECHLSLRHALQNMRPLEHITTWPKGGIRPGGAHFGIFVPVSQSSSRSWVIWAGAHHAPMSPLLPFMVFARQGGKG